MPRHVTKISKKAGLPPGSLVHVGKVPEEKISFSNIDFTPEYFKESWDSTLEECCRAITSPEVSWIQVYGIHDPQAIATIGRAFNLHPLILEDILNSNQRAKLEAYKEYLFIVVKMLIYEEESGEVSTEQASFILGNNYLISFLESKSKIFEGIKVQLRKDQSRMRNMGADYLLYAMLDVIVDNYFVILEKVDENLSELEEDLVNHPQPDILLSILKSKKEVELLRKAVWPMREVVSRLRQIDSPLINDKTKFYLHDVYDHAIQSIDIIEGFRDISSGMIDVYVSNINLRLNEVMKVLTVVATIFVPLTFIASIYGMNFSHMPELDSPYGYPLVLLSMLALVFIMLGVFRKKHWI